MPQEEFCHVDTTSFHDEVGSERYPFETNRYWLFTSKLCPFSQRAEIALARSGLPDAIGLTIAGPVQTEKGWNLSEYHLARNSQPSPICEIDRIPDLYQLAKPDYTGAMSIPILFDTKTQTIVNNESSEIVRMLDRLRTTEASKFNHYPHELVKDIEELCDFLATKLISPIYKAGFAKNQNTYESAVKQVYEALDHLDERLSNQKAFLAGSEVTAADIHAFPHLARFDAVFHSLYRLNRKFVRDYSSIKTYLERLSTEEGFDNTLDIETTKLGYFRSWNQPTNGLFVPIGPNVNPKTGVALT